MRLFSRSTRILLPMSQEVLCEVELMEVGAGTQCPWDGQVNVGASINLCGSMNR